RMETDAIALLKVPFKSLRKGLAKQEEEAGVILFASDGGRVFGMSPLKDGTAVHTFLPFFSSPDELSLGLGQLLGERLSAHKDKRGIFVFPDRLDRKSNKYAQAVDALEPSGFWVPVASPDRVQASVEQRMEQVIEFMAQMTALNQATAAGDERHANKARKAIARAFDDAHKLTVRATHPIARQIKKRSRKAVQKLQSAFEGVKLDDVQLAPKWQEAADEARALIQKDLAALKKGNRPKGARKPPGKG
ncbi:MAG: hypothetical protein ACJ790_12515, partial [Myxococcaceae bacterium]